MLLGLDLAPRKCGWCAGDGATIPTAGGWRLESDMEDLDGVMEETRAPLLVLLRRFQPTAVLYESPILPTNRWKGAAGPVVGSTSQRRAQFAQGAMVEWTCGQLRREEGWDITCSEMPLWDLKAALTGDKQATKEHMVAMALKLGIVLPAALVDGREDAADAVGAWLLLLRHHDKDRAAAWDRKIFTPRGALL